MASRSAENFKWLENIVFHVLFLNQLCTSKKAKTFDRHIRVLSQSEFPFAICMDKTQTPSPLLSPITLISYFSSPWMAKRSTFPRRCLTENMSWCTYVTDDAFQKIQVWISYKQSFKIESKNSARVIGAQWFLLKGRNWIEVCYSFPYIN